MCGGDGIYFWRQVLVVSATFFHSMAISFMLTFSAVLNLDILSPNTTDIRATADEASWIAATNGISGAISYLIYPFVMERFGRKNAFNLLNLTLVIGWFVLLSAKGFPALIIGRTIQGLGSGGIFINSLIISEYSHPSRRAYFTSIKKILGSIGTLATHALTLVCTWRQIAGIAITPALISALITCFWPESPAHLASKGRFEECKKSFYWLNEYSVSNKKELMDLLAAQMQQREIEMQRKYINKIKEKAFLKSLLMISIVVLILDTCGRYYFIVYIIQMMIEITGDKSVSIYCSVGGDCLSILGLSASCFVLKVFKRRTTLFVFGGFSILLMFSLGLIKFAMPNDVWLTAFVILLHYFIVNLSIIPVCFTLFGELFPIEFRGIGTCFAGIVLFIFYAITMKLTPLLMLYTGISGTYASYGVCIMICLPILYLILPETKDKTLQQIGDEIKDIKYSSAEMRPMF